MIHLQFLSIKRRWMAAVAVSVALGSTSAVTSAAETSSVGVFSSSSSLFSSIGEVVGLFCCEVDGSSLASEKIPEDSMSECVMRLLLLLAAWARLPLPLTAWQPLPIMLLGMLPMPELLALHTMTLVLTQHSWLRTLDRWLLDMGMEARLRLSCCC